MSAKHGQRIIANCVAFVCSFTQDVAVGNRKRVWFVMLHRHLNHQRFTLAAIDDIISRGRWQDWVHLRQAALSDRTLLDKVQHVCRPYLCDPYAQRHHFWMHYAEEHRTDA